MTHDEKLTMVENMERYGGSFVVALAKCFLQADSNNLKKLEATFPEYVDQYLNWGKTTTIAGVDFSENLRDLDNLTIR